jgi:RNA polymerase sigma-70 factor, ECF subfamily
MQCERREGSVHRAGFTIAAGRARRAPAARIDGIADIRDPMYLNCHAVRDNMRLIKGNLLERTGSTMAKPRGPDEGLADDAAGDGDGNDKSHKTDRSYASLDAFFEDVEKRAYRMAVFTLKDEQTALDAVQDAMLKLVEKYSGRPSVEWPALFFTILNNRMIDIQRWGRLREAGGKLISLFRSHDNGDEDLLETGLGSDRFIADRPEVESRSRELHNTIHNAVTKLSDRQRQVFLLREWQGFNVRETSEILGCSEGSVKQHHFRAMQALRKHLAGVWEDEK